MVLSFMDIRSYCYSCITSS